MTFDMEHLRACAARVESGDAGIGERGALLEWATALLLGRCCPDCGADTTVEPFCYCENDV